MSPSPCQGEGEDSEEGLKPLLNASALLTQSKGESKRGEASLIYPFPLPLIKGKGDKGGWGCQINQEVAKTECN